MAYYRLKNDKNKLEGYRRVYGSCSKFCCFKRYRLTEVELEKLNILRSNARVGFNKENIYHQNMLKRLWKNSFKDLDFPEGGTSEKWKELGFQGKDPTTDFRGVGLFGLEQLIYLSTRYPQEYLEMTRSAKTYSFAISALNITYMLMSFFQLHLSTFLSNSSNRILEVHLLKIFCKLNVASQDTINELYVAGVMKMHDMWVEMNKAKRRNVMEFNLAIKSADDLIVSLVESDPSSITELKKFAFG